MVIIGGLGSLIGSFFGAALHLDPADRPEVRPAGASASRSAGATAEHLTFMIVGALIIFFLIVEPHGLARLWQIGEAEAARLAVPVLRAARSKSRAGDRAASGSIVPATTRPPEQLGGTTNDDAQH